MYSKLEGRFLCRGGSYLIGVLVLGLTGCGSGGEPAFTDGAETSQVGELQQPITTWVDLDLRNSWKSASSVTPAVGIVNGIVTFRGALDGSKAGSPTAFCLGASKYDAYRIPDAGNIVLRAAMGNGKNGSMVVIGVSQPNLPAEDQYCVYFREDGSTSANAPGANAKVRTSLDGVSYDLNLSDSNHLTFGSGWSSPYPSRGSDGTAHSDGVGMFAKVVGQSVRFQGGAAGGTAKLLGTLPSGKDLFPSETIYFPVSACGGSGSASRIMVKSDGNVEIQRATVDASAQCGVHLDGLSFSSAGTADDISLSNGWVKRLTRAARARKASGSVVRLEGSIKNGTSTTIGTLPSGMWPSRTVYLVAHGITPSSGNPVGQIKINSSGVITLIAPSLAAAQTDGLSLDGVSFPL